MKIVEEDDNKCEMFGAFGYIVQLILGVIAFMVLVSKLYITL